MGYSTALEMRQSALRWLRSEQGGAWVRQCAETASPLDPKGAAQAKGEDFRTWQIGAVSESDVYYWHPVLCDPIQSAALSAPPIELRASMLPTDNGYCWFGSPLTDPSETKPDLVAISWAVVIDLEEDATLAITPWFRLDYAQAGLPVGPVVWRFGESTGRLHGATREGGWDQKADWIVRLLGSMLLFMEQRIVLDRPTEADRATRRRLQREDSATEALIHVVQLRRSEHQPAQRTGEKASVDWSCQWNVRPHWAMRRCGPGREHERPVWIAGYVKGPADKPLKLAPERLFVVAR